MCLFPLPNLNVDSLAYKKGVKEFDCGACPECLKKRSNVWALRSVYECKSHVHNCMITLTYDNFKRDDRGNIIGEEPVNPDLLVDKRHIQLFMKRLRKWYSSVTDEKVKYLCTAEYGSHTHRAHYHLILFGVKFPDIHYYKKSKRGNIIYMSDILSKLWGHGICTVDSINIHSGVARYCTKYCAKERSNDTFMLFSHNIGLTELLKDFNGINYMIDGREYPVPRAVWQAYIMEKYSNVNKGLTPLGCGFTFKYVNRDKTKAPFVKPIIYDNQVLNDDFIYLKNCAERACYREIRDNDPVYKNYIDYWSKKSVIFDKLKLTPIQRIYALDDSKYHSYKVKALHCYAKRNSLCLSDRTFDFVPYLAPLSNCVSYYEHYKEELSFRSRPRGHLLSPSRPNTANDTFYKTYDPWTLIKLEEFEILHPFQLKIF